MPTPFRRVVTRVVVLVVAGAVVVSCDRGPVAPSGDGAQPRATAPTFAPAPVAAPPAWSTGTTVGQIVAEQPATARIFELVGIDYCCGGDESLADACARLGRDADTLLAALLAVRPSAGAGDDENRSWARAPLVELIDHIETSHHAFLRRELPRLGGIVETVARVHGEHHPELAELQHVFGTLAREIPLHVAKEEAELFPAIRAAVAGELRDGVSQLAAEIEAEHDTVGAALHRLRELTAGFAVPSDACALYKQMLAGLRALEADLHAHVHKENSILLPRLARREW